MLNNLNTAKKSSKMDVQKHKIDEDDIWKVVDLNLSKNGAAQLQIDSYNNFLWNLKKLIED